MFGQKKEKQNDLEMFVYFDSKSKSYGAPMYAANKEDLTRSILNLFRDPETQAKNTLFLNAEDFSVFRVGSYDKSTGIVTAINPEHVVNLHDLRAISPNLSEKRAQVATWESHPEVRALGTT